MSTGYGAGAVRWWRHGAGAGNGDAVGLRTHHLTIVLAGAAEDLIRDARAQRMRFGALRRRLTHRDGWKAATFERRCMRCHEFLRAKTFDEDLQLLRRPALWRLLAWHVGAPSEQTGAVSGDHRAASGASVRSGGGYVY